MRNVLLTTLVATLLWSCGEKKTNSKFYVNTRNPHWRAVLEIPGEHLPFNFDLYEEEGRYVVEIHNAAEKIRIEDVYIKEDSIIIPGHIFASEIHARVIDGDKMEGFFVRLDSKEPYRIPFVAIHDQEYRFSAHPRKAEFDFDGNWEVHFVHEGDTTDAVGIFHQEGNHLDGTFLTSTGDYRYLDGEVDKKELHLSCFDGSHAFLFLANVKDDGTLEGDFWSGKHWHEKWYAKKNPDYKLPDADTLTHLVAGYDSFEFRFKDAETGKEISSDDERFDGKVTLVQIMGSWCPNCMDESVFLMDLEKKFPDVEVVALAFERSEDFNEAAQHIVKMKQKLTLDYPVLIAGVADKQAASEALPMLDHVLSYPTTIMIDKKGKVRNIHTGFTGPGTGDIYHKFADQYVMTVKKLLEEEG